MASMCLKVSSAACNEGLGSTVYGLGSRVYTLDPMSSGLCTILALNSWLNCLQDARRAGPMHKSEDPRVDVCIYLVSPHRIKKVDVKFMDELSKHVPVVPVLAKARDPIQIQGLGGGLMPHSHLKKYGSCNCSVCRHKIPNWRSRQGLHYRHWLRVSKTCVCTN